MPKIVDHEERRREVVRAVWRLVGREGLDALTTRAVAREAGWSTGVLAHYFTDRTDLLVAAFGLVAADAEARMRARLQEPDPVQALKLLLAEALPLDAVRRTEARVWFAFLGLAAANAALRPEAETHYTSWLTVTTEAVIAVFADAAVSRRRARSIASRLVALADGLTIQALFEPQRVSAGRLQRELDSGIDDVLAAARL